jgi:hypothetical protein
MLVDLDLLKTSKEVATMLKCTVRNVSHLVKAEKLKPIKVLENETFLFHVKDIDNFLVNYKIQKRKPKQ